MGRLSDEDMEILTNIIGAVESGGQVYGCRRYDAYDGAYANTPKEVTCTLGWAQNYGYEAMRLCNNIFEKDPAAFRKADTADIEGRLGADWVADRWDPDNAQKEALIAIITTDAGKKCQDELFAELMDGYIDKALSFDSGMSVQAQMMWCEIAHLGGMSAARRIFSRAEHPYTLGAIYSSLIEDQSDHSSENQVGDKIFQSRHDCCVRWIRQYVPDVADDNIARGQEESIRFTRCKIEIDGVRGEETKRQGVRVLQTALNNDYYAGLEVDGDLGIKTITALGNHYIRRGDTQWLVTAAEILLYLLGKDPRGVEHPGTFGKGLKKAANSGRITDKMILGYLR